MENINAEERLASVKQFAESLAHIDTATESGYAHLGWQLLEVAQLQLWRVQHDTFKDYLRSVALVAKRTTGQLHQYFLTVRDLSDTFTKDQLAKMGITKAIRLRTAKDYALVLPKAVVEAALDPKVTVRELRKVISVALKMPEEEGDWLDLGAEFYVSPEERATIEDAIAAAEHCDPVTKRTVSTSMQRKDIILKWAQEFLATYPADGVK